MGRPELALVDTTRSELIRCGHCGALKPPTGFYGQKRWCKECRKADEARRRADPGCIQRFQHRYQTDKDFRAAEMYRRLKKRAKAKGLEFDLDREWLRSGLSSGCALSGLPFDFTAGGLQSHGPSVDRIQAGGGYTKRNCRIVLACINLALLDWGFEAFVGVARAIAERNPR